MSVEVVRQLGVKNLAKIGDRLRETAQWADEHPEAIRTIIVIACAHDRVTSVCGYGERCSAVEAVGWLELEGSRVRGDGSSEPLTDFNPSDTA